jgi:ectoine hydroxylase-related dioxygenase (phytanoyl-CoA dioxygenase family)
MNYPSRPLSRRAAAVALCSAVIATSGLFGAIALLAERATSTPWLPADQAGLIAHCDAKTASAERRACVQAAVAWRDQTRMAATQGR